MLLVISRDDNFHVTLPLSGVGRPSLAMLAVVQT